MKLWRILSRNPLKKASKKAEKFKPELLMLISIISQKMYSSCVHLIITAGLNFERYLRSPDKLLRLPFGGYLTPFGELFGEILCCTTCCSFSSFLCTTSHIFKIIWIHWHSFFWARRHFNWRRWERFVISWQWRFVQASYPIVMNYCYAVPSQTPNGELRSNNWFFPFWSQCPRRCNVGYDTFFKYDCERIFTSSKPADNQKLWGVSLIFEIVYGGWLEIRSAVLETFQFCKSIELSWLLILLDNYCLHVLSMYSVTFKLNPFQNTKVP